MLITDKRMAELKQYATDDPESFYGSIATNDVLGLIERIELAEAICDEIVRTVIARANARAINVSQEASP
jgi:hypothetical protein